MSDQPNPNNLEHTLGDEKENHLPESTPHDRTAPKMVRGLMEQMEMLFMQKEGGDMSNFYSLPTELQSKALDNIAQNEERMYNYHCKKLDCEKEIAVKSIDASVINQKTTRITIIVIISAILFITILLVFTKDQYLIPWITFLTGIGGGWGISQMKLSSTPKLDNKSDNKEE
jgi:hypothetical protein